MLPLHLITVNSGSPCKIICGCSSGSTHFSTEFTLQAQFTPRERSAQNLVRWEAYVPTDSLELESSLQERASDVFLNMAAHIRD